MICSNCGQNNPAEARFCANCGSDMETAAETVPGAEEEEVLERAERRGRSFRLAFAWTAIPIVALGIVSTAGASSDGFYTLWFAGLGVWFIAILVAVGFALASKGQVAAGMLAGIAVGMLALAVSCFANLNTVEF